MAFPRPHIIAPTAKHTHTIILLHGRDSDGEEFAQQLSQGTTSLGRSLFELPRSSNCKWVFPSAHARMSTVFQEELTEWFDIYSLTDTEAEPARQIDGLRESILYVRAIIESEAELVPAGNIILGGISQGFAVASQVFLSCPLRLLAVIGLCGWIPFQSELRRVLGKDLTLRQYFQNAFGIDMGADDEVNTGVAAFVAHGRGDGVVDFQHGMDARDVLENFGLAVTFREYSDADYAFNSLGDEGDRHWIPEPKGYDDLAAFLFQQVCRSKIPEMHRRGSETRDHQHSRRQL